MADIEGAIHIVKIDKKKSWVWLARPTGGAGGVPHREFDTHQAVDAFLQKIGVLEARRRQALAELQTTPAVTAGFVRLASERLKDFGLIV